MCTAAEGHFDLILNIGNSLSLLQDQVELKKAMLAAAAMLDVGGYLVVQILNYQALKAEPVRKKKTQVTVDGKSVQINRRLCYQGENVVLDFKIEGDSSYRTQSILSPWTLENITNAAQKAGMLEQERYGGYDLSPYGPESGDYVAIFQATQATA